MKTARYIPYAVGAAVAGVFPLMAGVYMQQVAITILIYMTLAITWDMLLRSGQLNFGNAGFFGIGSYAAVLLFINTGMPALSSIALGGLITGGVALILGLAILRLRGLYFAIITLALAMVFPVVARNLSGLTGGAAGRALPTVLFRGDAAQTYWLVLGFAVLVILFSEFFERTRIRFALTAMRNDEKVAKSSGINVYMYLVFAFTLTSVLQGVAGGLYAHIFGFVAPESSFNVMFLLLPMTMALLGGIYSTWGPVAGALILGVVAEYLKLQIPYGHLMVYGAVIVVVTLFAPRGVLRAVKTQFVRLMAVRGSR